MSMWGKPGKPGKAVVPSTAGSPRGRTIAGNSHVVTAVVCGPDAFSQQLANGMAISANTFSPMAAGIHNPSTQPRGYTGDRGHGVNRWAGRTPYPLQNFRGAASAVLNPRSRRLGIGAGVAGQPGLPNTGDATNLGPLAYMGWQATGHVGFRG